MTSALAVTAGLLQKLRARTDAVILAYSGGKDSIACLDILIRARFRVVCVYWYYVPGLEIVERWIAWARARYGVEVYQVPHPGAVLAIREGTFTPIFREGESITRDYRLSDALNLVRRKTGIDWCALGSRACDSPSRYAYLTHNKGIADKERHAFPVWSWRPAEIRAYLRQRHIPKPIMVGSSFGVSLQDRSVLWLYENAREDYERMLIVYPGIEAIVMRREFYPQPERRGARKKSDGRQPSKATREPPTA